MGDVMHITATINMQVDVPNQLSAGQKADLLEDVSAYIRQQIAGKQIWQAYIVSVSDLKIKSIDT